VWVQRLAVKAAVTGDAQLLKQAALLDPLTGAVCNPPEVWQMVDEMLVAQARWLPQYAGEIEKAEARMAQAQADGSWIPLRDYHGAARLKPKTVEEMALDADRMRRMASAAAKERVEQAL
jgi:alpha-galactosidase